MEKILLNGMGKNIDEKALEVFANAIRRAGGIDEFGKKRNLDWLPLLLKASYAVVYKKEGYDEKEIAELLSMKEKKVRNFIQAEPFNTLSEANEALKYDKNLNPEIAGCLVKWGELDKFYGKKEKQNI